MVWFGSPIPHWCSYSACMQYKWSSYITHKSVFEGKKKIMTRWCIRSCLRCNSSPFSTFLTCTWIDHAYHYCFLYISLIRIALGPVWSKEWYIIKWNNLVLSKFYHQTSFLIDQVCLKKLIAPPFPVQFEWIIRT